MKNLVLGMTMALSGVLLIMTIIIHASVMTRSSELKEKLPSACENALSQVMEEYRSYDIESNEGKKELIGALLQNLSSGLDSDSDYKVEILDIDANRGLLKVKVTETHPLPGYFMDKKNMKTGTTATCTVIYDQDLRYRTKYVQDYYQILLDDPATLADELHDRNKSNADGSIEIDHDIDITEYPRALYKEVTVALGDSYVIPDDPVIPGYEFLGWYDKNGNLFAKDGQLSIAENVSWESYMTVSNSPTELYGRFQKE